jgi:hypothetical protein
MLCRKYEKVCLLATFIKRFANLSLLAAGQTEMDANELFLAVSESLRCVRIWVSPHIPPSRTARCSFRAESGLGIRRI